MTWDAILFNDEVHLLALRLRLLAGVVDHVVVVEGTATFSGLQKPLHFADGALDLSWFPGEVHSVVVPLPVGLPASGQPCSPWDREHAQRAAMGQYLAEQAAPGDLILVGDVDELPRPAVVRRLRETLREPARLQMRDALYYANWLQPEPWMLGTVATRLDGFSHPAVAGMLGTPLGADARFTEQYVPDAGWHLSFLGGPDAMVRKLAAYSHQELNTDAIRRSDFLRSCFRYGTHFAGWAPLRRVTRDELDRELAPLATTVPELFDFTTRSCRLETYAWCAWAWSRDRLPARVTSWLDSHPRTLLVAFGMVLVPVQLARERKRRRSGPPRWPSGKQFELSSA